MTLTQKFLRRFQIASASLKNDWQTARLARAVAGSAIENQSQGPIVFFNASTRIRGHSLNAAFSLLASWSLQLVGVPVIHFVCRAGMSRCVLGTDQDDVYRLMPCRLCLRQSRANYAASETHYFSYHRDAVLAKALADLDIGALVQYEHPFGGGKIPLGVLALPAIRWRLRRLTLVNDDQTRFLYREFILSAWNIAREFTVVLERTKPQAVVVFNGQVYPEATVSWVAHRAGVRVVTHEVSMYPLSGFFTTGEATALPMPIPDSFELNPGQSAQLDALMQSRFQGKVSMAGIQFFPKIKGLDAAFDQKAANFRQIVPVFTNVIFDTTQQHSNAFFLSMFTWLDAVLGVIKAHPDTLFIMRAHPDEARPGKVSRESVAMWVEEKGVGKLPNCIFVAPEEYISSYELIRRSKFVMIYNSTIGLEASIMGVPVLCAGSARFTNFSTVFFPDSQDAYLQQLESFLTAPKVRIQPEHIRNARRFFYYHYFIASLRFGDYIEPTAQRGYVKWSSFDLQALSPEASPTMRALQEGILYNGDFMLKE